MLQKGEQAPKGEQRGRKEYIIKKVGKFSGNILQRVHFPTCSPYQKSTTTL
jgi:hypothetical protein